MPPVSSFKPTYTRKARRLRTKAIKQGHLRLLVIALYGDPTPSFYQWFSFPTEEAMQAFIESPEEATCPAANCVTPIAVVKPHHPEAIIHAILRNKKPRRRGGYGFFKHTID